MVPDAINSILYSPSKVLYCMYIYMKANHASARRLFWRAPLVTIPRSREQDSPRSIRVESKARHVISLIYLPPSLPSTPRPPFPRDKILGQASFDTFWQ